MKKILPLLILAFTWYNARAAFSATTIIQQTKCYGDSNGVITVIAAGGVRPYQYALAGLSSFGPDSVFTNLKQGVYSVIVKDNSGQLIVLLCTLDDIGAIDAGYTLSEATSPDSSDGNIKILNGYGGTSPYQYLWNSGSTQPDIYNLSHGIYTLTITDVNGCSNIFNWQITSGGDGMSIYNTWYYVTCYGDSDGALIGNVASGGHPPYLFHLSNGLTQSVDTFYNLPTGRYSILVTDAGSTDSVILPFQILQGSAPLEIAGVSLYDSCNNKRIALSATGGVQPYYFSWTDSSSVIANTQNISSLYGGVYNVMCTDWYNCTRTINFIIASDSSLEISATIKDPTCYGLSNGLASAIVSGGTPPYTCSWNGQPGMATLGNLAAGIYTLVISDSKGCTLPLDSFNLQYQYNINVTTGPGSTIQLGGTTEITSTSNIATGLAYSWSPMEGLDCSTCPNSVVQPVRTGWYYIAVQDSNGCTANDSVLITVIPNYDLFIPNAFTPNGDGNNDYFEMFGNKAAIIYWQIEVFNRWGEKVFESHDVNFGWDGSYKGKLQDPGVFVYEGKAVFLDDHSTSVLKGSVTLIR